MGKPKKLYWTKNPYCVSSKNFDLKDNNRTAHSIVHLKLKMLDTDNISKETISLMIYNLV